jgi:hypothetical protein
MAWVREDRRMSSETLNAKNDFCIDFNDIAATALLERRIFYYKKCQMSKPEI